MSLEHQLEEACQQAKTFEWEYEKSKTALEEETQKTNNLKLEIEKLSEQVIELETEVKLKKKLGDEKQLSTNSNLSKIEEHIEAMRILGETAESLLSQNDRCSISVENFFKAAQDLTLTLDSQFTKELAANPDSYKEEDLAPILASRFKHIELLEKLREEGLDVEVSKPKAERS